MSNTAKMPKREVSHHEFPIHKLNSGYYEHMGVLPLPPADGLSIKINTYDDVPEEPRFDPAVHLSLKRPSFVRLFPDFDRAVRTPRVNSYKGSQFAWSSPFQVRKK